MSSKNKKIIVNEESKQKRLDIFLTEKLRIPRSQIKKMVEGHLVFLDGNLAKKAGEKLTSIKRIEIKEAKEIILEDVKNELNNFDVCIVKETDDYIVVEKPAGLLVHPTEAKEKVTLVNILLQQFPEIKNVGENKVRPGIVHRLDKEASGLLVVAKTQKMFEHLKEEFKKREIEKIYSVLVYGGFENDHGIIDFNIDRGKDGRMVARPLVKELNLKSVKNIQEGKKAKTEFWVKQTFGRFSLLDIKIYSGRTHQIRVHMFAYGHPVVGDKLYFNKKLIKKQDTLARLFLHAKKLCFTDLQGKDVCFESKLPNELEKFLANYHKIT